ncbi:MAG TPA: hypothetical protein DER60_10120 [Syntrophomonas sp.]|jgi:hypothetical protein|nr:hypothetical protein [Syntrophomonas sp.]
MNEYKGAKRLPSKKNDVYRYGDVVIKKFSDAERFRMETEIGSLLEKSDILTPPRLSVNQTAYINVYRFIEAIPVVDLIEDSELQLAEEIVHKIYLWVMDFYALTREMTGQQYILGDVHLRNFLYQPDSQKLYGIDFEECRQGRIESDLARFYVFLLHYDPAFTPRKKALGAFWLDIIQAPSTLDINFFQQEVERETAELLARRQHRNSSLISPPVREQRNINP